MVFAIFCILCIFGVGEVVGSIRGVGFVFGVDFFSFSQRPC